MPTYEIYHSTTMSVEQQDKLAETITKSHSTIFTTPSSFVRVWYHHVTTPTYVAGKRQKSNMVRAYIRAGPGRTQDQYRMLCTSIHEAWNEIVGGDSESNKLQSISVLGSIIAGWEAGFMRPAAGLDKEWLQENLVQLQKVAETDSTIRGMLHELYTRDEFAAVFTALPGS